MATYVPSLKGYVTDVPEIWLKRADDKVFHFDQLSSSNVSPDTQFTEVTGGWSLYPVAYLPGQSTMEMTFESSQFDADLFALATNTEFKSQTVGVWGHASVIADSAEQEDYEFDYSEDLSNAVFYVNGFKVAYPDGDKLPDGETASVIAGEGSESGSESAADQYEEVTSTELEGVTSPAEQGWYEESDGVYTLTEDQTVSAQKTYYKKVSASNAIEDISPDGTGVDTAVAMNVAQSEYNAATNTYKIRVSLADPSGIKKGDEVQIDWVLDKAVDTIQVDNQQTFVGEAILRWPVYSSGEEVKAAGVKGYVMMHIYKCRCTAMPGFDTSYKSAVTNGITLSAMDPHRTDGAIYSMSFVEK